MDGAKLISFYLPQFHPIPENDWAWGPGFTEWTNVSAAKPLFPGHNQPRIPAELGHYDLRVPEVMRKQAALAKAHGIYGFCYYYYWFDGRRVLEKPLELMLDDPSIDMPFCLCWANENWTKRWDGSEHEVIISQTFAPELRTNIIKDMEPYFSDHRYIKVGNKHLLLVYRPGIVPNTRETLDSWREAAREMGIELYIAACITFGFDDPMRLGFDGCVEFPPHGLNVADVKDSVEWTKPFEGHAYSFSDVVQRELAKPEYPFPTFRSAMAGWDNTPRRGVKGHVFLDATPDKFEAWLSALVVRSQWRHPPDQRFVFINAWNEWAEGAHLEPDQKFGRQWLQACARAVGAEVVKTDPDVDNAFLNSVGKELEKGKLDAQTQRLFELATAYQSKFRSAAALNRSLTEIYFSWLEYFQQRDTLRLSATEKLLGGVEEMPASITGWIETPKGQPIAAVRREEPWFINGWLFFVQHETLVASRCVLTFFSRHGTQSRSTYALYPKSRPDVADYHAKNSISAPDDAGFQAYVDLRTLEPGEYVVKVGLLRENELSYIEDCIRLNVS